MRDIDVVLRYKPMVDFIRSNAHNGMSILEVGAGREGIAKYLQEFQITAVDKFQQNILPNVQQVAGEAAHLPFPDNSFDIVISSDMLEHVPERERRRILQEFLRVGRKYVLIGFPCGEGAAYWEKKLFTVAKALTGKEHRWVKEHLEYGLPEERKVKEWLKGKDWKVRILDNGSGMLWCLNQFLNPFLYPVLYLLHPLLASIRLGKPYRKIFIVERLARD